ncbi:hypothetical protein BDR26DRAFT_849273 [Obelidium mucronatum]|nr:hypothetical protein BDR26DRAFT_849273 [Obelidium mucronatum]
MFQRSQSSKTRADSAISLSPVSPTPRMPPIPLNPPKLSVILFTCNNESSISSACSKIISSFCSLRKHQEKVDFVLIDSASLDDTVGIAQRVFESNQKPLTIYRDSRMTKWESKILQGMTKPDVEHVVFLNLCGMSSSIGLEAVDLKNVLSSISSLQQQPRQSHSISFFPRSTLAMDSCSRQRIFLWAAEYFRFPMDPSHLDILVGHSTDFSRIAHLVTQNRKLAQSKVVSDSLMDSWWMISRSVEESGVAWNACHED